MPKLIDLTNKRFGRLLVIARDGSSEYGQPKWHAKCECGSTKTYFGNALRSGATNSCGCLQQETVTKHGKSKTREFLIWQMMLQRCNNPNHVAYKAYGGRGITVCQEWAQSFQRFLADMGSAPSDTHTLDRTDNSLGYCKENCAWRTPMEQGANKRNNRHITANGKTLHINEWARLLNTGKSTLLNRLARGMAEHDVVTKPIVHKRLRDLDRSGRKVN